MKQTTIESEQALRTALRDALRNAALPAFTVRENLSKELFDFWLTAEIDGQAHVFAVDCRLKATAKDVEFLSTTPFPAPPLLATVHLTESLAALCKERNVNCIDLNGRLWLRARGFLIDRHAPPSSVSYGPPDPDVAFFAPKSTRLPRALLHARDRTWRQSDLAQVTGLSQGLLSRLLNYAADQGWVYGKRGDWKLAKRDALLDAWERADVFSKRVTLKQYSLLERDVRAIARQLVDATQGELAFSQWFAATLRHPYTDVPIVSAYRREFPTEDDQRRLNYREVDDGGRVWILVPRDDGVFRSIQRIEGLPLASDAQIYLDLIQAGLRGPDQAKALRDWEGFCTP